MRQPGRGRKLKASLSFEYLIKKNLEKMPKNRIVIDTRHTEQDNELDQGLYPQTKTKAKPQARSNSSLRVTNEEYETVDIKWNTPTEPEAKVKLDKIVRLKSGLSFGYGKKTGRNTFMSIDMAYVGVENSWKRVERGSALEEDIITIFKNYGQQYLANALKTDVVEKYGTQINQVLASGARASTSKTNRKPRVVDEGIATQQASHKKPEGNFTIEREIILIPIKQKKKPTEIKRPVYRVGTAAILPTESSLWLNDEEDEEERHLSPPANEKKRPRVRFDESIFEEEGDDLDSIFDHNQSPKHITDRTVAASRKLLESQNSQPLNLDRRRDRSALEQEEEKDDSDSSFNDEQILKIRRVVPLNRTALKPLRPAGSPSKQVEGRGGSLNRSLSNLREPQEIEEDLRIKQAFENFQSLFGSENGENYYIFDDRRRIVIGPTMNRIRVIRGEDSYDIAYNPLSNSYEISGKDDEEYVLTESVEYLKRDMDLNIQRNIQRMGEEISNDLVNITNEMTLSGQWKRSLVGNSGIEIEVQEEGGEILFHIPNSQTTKVAYRLEGTKLTNNQSEPANQIIYKGVLEALSKDIQIRQTQNFEIGLEAYKNLFILLEAATIDIKAKIRFNEDDKSIALLNRTGAEDFRIFKEGFIKEPAKRKPASTKGYSDALVLSRELLTEDMLEKLSGDYLIGDFTTSGVTTSIVKNDDDYEIRRTGLYPIKIDGIGKITSIDNGFAIDDEYIPDVHAVCELCYNLKKAAEISLKLNEIKTDLANSNDPLIVDDYSYQATVDSKLLIIAPDNVRIYIDQSKISSENGEELSPEDLRNFVRFYGAKIQEVVDAASRIAGDHAEQRKSDVENIRQNIAHINWNGERTEISKRISAIKGGDDAINFRIESAIYKLAQDGESILDNASKPAPIAIHEEIKQAFANQKALADRKAKIERLAIGKRAYDNLQFLIDSQISGRAEVQGDLVFVPNADGNSIEIFLKNAGDGSSVKDGEIFRNGKITKKSETVDVFEDVTDRAFCELQEQTSRKQIQDDVTQKLNAIFTTDGPKKFGNIEITRVTELAGVKYQISKNASAPAIDIIVAGEDVDSLAKSRKIQQDCYNFYYQHEAEKFATALQEAIGDKEGKKFSHYKVGSEAQGITIAEPNKAKLTIIDGKLTKQKGQALSPKEIKDFVIAHNNPEEIANIIAGFQINEVADKLRNINEIGKGRVDEVLAIGTTTYEISENEIIIEGVSINDTAATVNLLIKGDSIKIVDTDTELTLAEKKSFVSQHDQKKFFDLKTQRVRDYVEATTARLKDNPARTWFADSTWNNAGSDIKTRTIGSDTIQIEKGEEYFTMSGGVITLSHENGTSKRTISLVDFAEIAQGICDPVNKAVDEAIAMNLAIANITKRFKEKSIGSADKRDQDYMRDTDIVRRLIAIQPHLLAEKFEIVPASGSNRIAELKLKGAVKATVVVNKSKKEAKSGEKSWMVNGDSDAVMNTLREIERASGKEIDAERAKMTAALNYIKDNKSRFSFSKNPAENQIIAGILSHNVEDLVNKFEVVEITLPNAAKIQSGEIINVKNFELRLKSNANAKIGFVTDKGGIRRVFAEYKSTFANASEIETALKDLSPAAVTVKENQKIYNDFYDLIEVGKEHKINGGKKIKLKLDGVIQFDTMDSSNKPVSYLLYENGKIQKDGVDVDPTTRSLLAKEAEEMEIDDISVDESLSVENDGSLIDESINTHIAHSPLVKSGSRKLPLTNRPNTFTNDYRLLGRGLNSASDGGGSDDEDSLEYRYPNQFSKGQNLLPVEFDRYERYQYYDSFGLQRTKKDDLDIRTSIEEIKQTVPENGEYGWYHEFRDTDGNHSKRLFEQQENGGYTVFQIPVNDENGNDTDESAILLNYISEEGDLYDDKGALIEPSSKEYKEFLTYCKDYHDQEVKRFEKGQQIYQILISCKGAQGHEFRLKDTKKVKDNIYDVSYDALEEEFTMVNSTTKKISIVDSKGTIFNVDEKGYKVERTFYEGYKTELDSFRSKKPLPNVKTVEMDQPTFRKQIFSNGRGRHNREDRYNSDTSVDDEVGKRRVYEEHGISKADIELKIKPSNSIRATGIQKITAVTILVNRSHLSVRGQKFKVLEGIYKTEADGTVDAKTLDPVFARILTVVADELNLKQTDVKKIVAYARKNGGVSHKLTTKGYKDQTSEEISKALGIDGETVKAFSRIYQDTCKECGIYSGKETSAEGSRLTYISDDVMNSYATIGKNPHLASTQVKAIQEKVIRKLGGEQVIGR